jgi:hypothetical protein
MQKSGCLPALGIALLLLASMAWLVGVGGVLAGWRSWAIVLLLLAGPASVFTGGGLWLVLWRPKV